MKLPHDFKDYKAPNAFQMIAEESAGRILLVLVLACFVIDVISRR